MAEQSFKERVAQTAITQAKVYNEVFVQYEYLICSSAFSKCKFYILSARPDNYRHLIGVNTDMSAGDFYEKCLSGELKPDDFNFIKRGQTEKEVKGAVRDKLHALPAFLSMLDKPLMAQESFVQNRVHCSFATTEHTATVGFIAAGKSRPMTLLRGDKLDPKQSYPVDMVLRRSVGARYFDSMICGNPQMIEKYYDAIEGILAPELHPEHLEEPVLV